MKLFSLCKTCFYFFICFDVIGITNAKHYANHSSCPSGVKKEDSPIASNADSENMDDIEASVDDLVYKDTIPPTMFIGPSLVSDTTIKFYERKWWVSS